ncbi:MAG: RecQ family ATP-dependent DNA helicase [Bacteroidetes bacterium]|nr:RecQ family ATP-dependent DNA helicase [Bacteroidota bacterium]
MTSHDWLKKYWGHSAFRAPQEEVIEASLAGKDVLAVLPTGAGKSICFQVTSLMKEGVCIVVTPLIALMQDQVQQLKRRGIAATAVHSGLNSREIDIALDNCVYGKEKFLYVSPERLQTEMFVERFKKMNVNLVAIDEAHCISQWGYDFRPPYLLIASLRELKPGVPFMALTASATKLVRNDIVEKLQLKSPSVFLKSFARENLSLVVRKTETKEKKLLEILRKVPGPGIVYVRSRKATEVIAKLLVRNSISATFYHAGLPADERLNRQQQWISNEVRVMVATNAFGMGINKADVRTVVHLDLPESIESYYQEAGRAGRDGKRSYATVIYHEADVLSLRHKTELAQPDLDYLKTIYQALANHFQLAEGSSQGEAFDFDLDRFSKQYNFSPAAVHPALKKMEEFGLIQLNEGFHRPSRVHFSMDKKRMYEFQVANARFDPIIKMMLRLYGAELFSDFVVISETNLASGLKLSLPEVKLELQKLHRLQLLIYEPASNAPQVVFVLPRQDADRLPIEKKEMDRRRDLHLQKMESMIEYAEQNHRCRMQLIQEYFDEVTYQTCGICDVCLEKKKSTNLTLFSDYSEQIAYLLNQKPMPVDDLETAVAPRDKELFVEVVRELVDAGTIYYDDHWILHKKEGRAKEQKKR